MYTWEIMCGAQNNCSCKCPLWELRMDSPWIHRGSTALCILGSLCAGLFPLIQTGEFLFSRGGGRMGGKKEENKREAGKEQRGGREK